jgi:O-antigen ligase
MFTQLVGKSFKLNSLPFQITAGCCLGLLLGMACSWFSPLLVFSALVTALLTYAILKRPEIALLGILVATSSILYEDQLPMISVGISFHIPDMLLLGSFGIIVVRLLVQPNFKVIRTPLDWPLLVFFGITIFSTSIALYQSTVDVEVARRAFRVFSYYLTFFVVTNLVRERRQINTLLNGFFILATIVAAAIVLQFIVGSSAQLLPGRVEILATQGAMYEDITRVLPPGWSVVLVSFVVILCILVLEKNTLLPWIKFLQLGLMGMALIFTFLRSYWAALLIIFLFMGYFFKAADRKKYIGLGLISISLIAIILLIVFTDPDSRAARLTAASSDRLGTLFDSGTFQGEDGSLNWRMIENEYAFSTIASNPWLGLGMGFTYRPWDPRLDRPDFSGLGYDFRKHIHNGHLWILLQSGVLGYFSLMWLSLTFLIRGFRNWRYVLNNRFKGVVLGFTLAYLAIFVAAVANSSFTQWRWTPILGIMMGINEVIFAKSDQEAG